MFKIYDGREQFWQWDLNQKLIVEDPEINEVHFCNRTDDCSLVVEVVDGLANVPNILLQQDWKIKVYAYSVDHTKHEACFKVKTRSKPADYVYTETEIKSWEAYGERIAALEANGGSGGIAELPEGDNFIADLATGIYRVNGIDGSSMLWLDDAYWLGIVDGVVIVENPQDTSDIKWTAIGIETSWTPVYYTGTTTWNTDDEYWECINFGDVEHTGNKVNSLAEPSIYSYPSTKAVVDYVDTYVETTDVWSYSKDNLIKETAIPGNNARAYNAMADKNSNTSTGVYTLYIDLRVYLARKRNGSFEEIVKHPYSIVEDESGMLIIEDTANTIEAAVVFGTPDNKYTFTDIINSMVGNYFTDYKVIYDWVRVGTEVKKHAVGLSARLELYGNNEAVVDSVYAEVNTLLAQSTHILFYYRNTPFNLIEGG